MFRSDGVCGSGTGYHPGNTRSKRPKKDMAMSLIRVRYVMKMTETSRCHNCECKPEWYLPYRFDESLLVVAFIMISEDVYHGSHGLFPRDAVAGRFLVIFPVSGLFVPDFALIGGVHVPHEMMLTPTERLALSAKPGVFLFCEGSG